MPTLIQFGAGNIGRSFVAQLFAAAGYTVIFVDVQDELVAQLNAVGRYRVMIKDEYPETLWVEGVRAIHGKDVAAVAEALAEADIVATSVGPNALPYLYPAIAQGLQLRQARYPGRPIGIILAENLRNAGAIVRNGLLQHLPADFPLEALLGLVETSIGKMVPIMTDGQRYEDPLWVFAEAYNTLILDANAFKNAIPAVTGLSPKQNMTAYVDRKLFIHNLGHAAVAYHGHLYDRTLDYIWQAMEVDSVRAAAEAAMWESARALMAAYPGEFTETNLAAHIADLLRRFTNKALGDTIFRVGRDLLRKLSAEDRIIGAMRFDQAHGIPFTATAGVAAAALEFRRADERGRLSGPDTQFIEDYYPQGLDVIFERVCGLTLANAQDHAIAESIRGAHATTMAAESTHP